MPPTDALQISSSKSGSTLTPSQKRFNTLLRKIEQARQTLAAWHDGVSAYRQAHADVLKPLQEELLAGHRRWIFALDVVLEQRQWGRADRDLLSHMLCEAAGTLIDQHGEDTELKALFNKHSAVDFDTDERERMIKMKDMAQAMTGIDLGDDVDVANDAELLERLQQALQEKMEAEDEQAGAKAAKRRPSAAQQRKEAEAQEATQSVREVFRKLASALHPDREADERRREAKTAQMQRVNQAYQAGDLLALLELQLEIEQIDASHIANAGEKRLKHYNKVLAEQLDELKSEIEYVEYAFCIEFGLQPASRLTPDDLPQVLEEVRRDWSSNLVMQGRELRILDDVAETERWLKRERQRLSESNL